MRKTSSICTSVCVLGLGSIAAFYLIRRRKQEKEDLINIIKWRQIGQTIDSDFGGSYNDGQPVSISQDGARVVLGPPGCDDTAKLARVKVYDFDGKCWDEVKSFSGDRKDAFGCSIALSGNGKTLAIGSPKSYEGGNYNGHVEVHCYTEDNGWKQKGHKLVGLQSYINLGYSVGRRFDDWFGESIALSEDGNRISIQAPGGGYVGIFQYQDEEILRAVLRDVVDHFIKGPPVSIDWASLVGEFTGIGWVQMGQTIFEGARGGHYKDTVSLSADGSIVAIASPFSPTVNGPASGSVQIFQYFPIWRNIQETEPFNRAQSTQDGGQWLQLGQKIQGAREDALFGSNLTVNAKGNIIAVSSFYGGHVEGFEVFHYEDKIWQCMSKFQCARNSIFNICISLAANAHRIAVGINDKEKNML